VKKHTFYPIVLLTIVLLVGLFLRFYGINLNTPPLYADETSQYFIADSILTNPGNLVFNVRNAFISFTWFLGLNPLGVRLPPAIYGVVLIFAGYLFGLQISGNNKKTALLMALLMAVSPWSFMISRIGHASVPILLIFVLLHILVYLRARRIRGYFLSLIPLGIATAYYPSMAVIAPFVLTIIILEINKLLIGKQKMLFGLASGIIIIFTGLLLSSRYNLFSTGGRALDLAIWRDVNTPYEIDKYRAMSWNSQPSIFSFYLPPETLANKLAYNRVMANITIFTRNYLSFFSPEWLFLKGDAVLRHSTGQVGALYPFLIPFMLYGGFVFFKTADKKIRWTFLFWIIASPIPAAITKDGAGYLLRAVTMLPFLTYFCALGIVDSFNSIKKIWRIPYGILVALIGLYSAYYFFYGYFHVYPSLSARSYEYGFKELSDFQVVRDNASMLIIWDGYYHNNDFRFWQATPYEQYNSFKTKEIVVGESHFWQTFPNLYFVNPRSGKDILTFLKQYPVNFVVLPDRYFVNYPAELDKIFVVSSAIIEYPDQTPALQIYSVKQ